MSYENMSIVTLLYIDVKNIQNKNTFPLFSIFRFWKVDKQCCRDYFCLSRLHPNSPFYLLGIFSPFNLIVLICL